MSFMSENFKMRLGRRMMKSTFLNRLQLGILKWKTKRVKSNEPFVAVLSMGENGHSYSAARAVKALGHKAVLITDTPQLHEMLNSNAIIVRDPLTEIDAILDALDAYSLEAVVISIKHLLLPAQAKIAERFQLVSSGHETGVLNNDKFLWRTALADAGVDQPAFSRSGDIFENLPCIYKPVLGTGSVGVRALSAETDKKPYEKDGAYFEGAIDGAQYDFEGVVEDGKITTLVHVLENYINVNDTFAAQYFLFWPTINDTWMKSLSKCVDETIKASKIVNGAFHLEMRMDGDQAMPIDFANRMGYERFVSFASGQDFAKAHVNCFLRENHALTNTGPKGLIQYFCWDRESFEIASRIRDENPEHVFDQLMESHLFAGEECYGMIVFKHESTEALLKMIEPLKIVVP